MQVDDLMYKPLLDITPTDGIDYAHSLASHVTWNSNGTVYTITLSHKYRWSNGKPVSAQDIVFTWDLIKASTAPNAPWTFGGEGFGGIPSRWVSVVAKGPDTVVITLNKPSNQQWFLRNGIGQFIPVPQSVWDKYPHNMTEELKFVNGLQNTPTAPEYDVVDGPYHFQKSVPNQYWSFVPNRQYGGHASYLNKVIFEYQTSDSQEFAALKTGTINVGYLPYSLWDSRTELTHDTIHGFYPFGFNYMNLNWNAPDGIGKAFSNLYVRQALQMGINQSGIIKGLYHNMAVTEDGPLPSKPLTMFYDDKLPTAPYLYNIAAGRKLLEAHGWRMVHGVLTRHGVPLSFSLTYASGSQAATDSVQLIAQDWDKEGMHVTLNPQEGNTAFGEMVGSQNNWDMMYFAGGWTYEPDYYPTGGGLSATGAGGNYSHYSSSTMNKLVLQSYQPVSSTANSLALLDSYQRWAIHDLPVLWMPYFSQITAHSDNIHGVVSTENPVSYLLSPNYWWISPTSSAH